MHSEATYKVTLENINRFFLYVMVPVLGVSIPNIAGFIINSNFTATVLLCSYIWFILTAFIIWKGNVLLLKKIRRPGEENAAGYYRTLAVYFGSNLLFTTVSTLLMLSAWYGLFNPHTYSWGSILHTTVIILFFVIIINAFYEIFFLRQEMEDGFVKLQLLETDKIRAELSALKSQIDPHFIFNSLNTLSYLINSRPTIARIYNDTLAKVYRYILVYKDQNLVFLKEELEFVSNYFFLINIRYEEAVNLVMEIPDVKAENYLVPPVSLQMLIENAIKHNDFSKADPLQIHIGVQSNFVTVKNKINIKEYSDHSAGIGLKNLNDRSFLITKKHINISNEKSEFVVKMPILKS